MTRRIDVLMQPIGKEIGVLEAPLAKYSPDMIVIFTNMVKQKDLIQRHLNHGWSRYVKNPKLVLVELNEPWREETIEEYMRKFDEEVEKIRSGVAPYDKIIAKGKDEINFYVGLAGGTNLMAIASALSAYSYDMMAYYSTEAKHNPEATDPSNLLVELPIIGSLGPAISYLRRRPRHKQCLSLFKESSSLGRTDIQMEMNVTKASQYTTDLLRFGLIERIDTAEWKITPMGRMALNRVEWKEME